MAFRAFYALPVDNFSTPAGQATNAVWGFFTMLSEVIETEHPTLLAVAFDTKGGTFRNDMLEGYKGTRQATPEELLSQLPIIQQMLGDLGVTYIEKPGYEADDIIGTLATMGESDGLQVLVLSGDRDVFQLIDDHVTVLFPGYHFKDLKHMTPQAVFDKYGVTPAQYPDLAALRGEQSDNIPGVPGVGDGYASKWISKYGSLDGIIEHADEITGKKGQALRDNIEQVQLNRRVNALVRDLDLDVTMPQLSFGRVDTTALNELFNELDFGTRTRRRFLAAFTQVDQAPNNTDNETTLVEPQIDIVHTSQELLDWAKQYCPASTPAKPLDERVQVMDIVQQLQHGENTCVEAVQSSWTLHAEGSAKPGASSLRRVTLLSRDHAVCIGTDDPAMMDALQHILTEYASTLVVHSFKEHLHMLASNGVSLPMPLFDTKLAGYLVEPDYTGSTLDDYVEHFLDVVPDTRESEPQGTLDLDGLDDDTDDVTTSVRRAALVAALARFLAPGLQEREQYGLLRAIEMPVSYVLFRMERTGAGVDLLRLDAMRATFANEASTVQNIAWQAAGTECNLQSPKQLGTILFADMGLTPTKKTKKGSYSTNAATLQKLYAAAEEGSRPYEFLGALLRYRETNKLKQIVQSLIDTVNTRDGRIHTTFEQTVAATGRLSSVDPNLQNIPNRNAQGREIRSAFVPADGYMTLLSADYSQVELRIMADLSGDEALIEAFRSGVDFHRYVASLVFGRPADEITPDERSHVKAMSYGLAYGLSTYGLSQQLGITPREADKLRDQYFTVFGKVHDYLESLVSTARRLGYTETMFGRRRYFPALQSANRVARDAAERAALNAPIQGSAADIMKIAMIRAEHALRSHGLSSRIVLQIHDELVVELAPGEQDEVTALVKDAMEHAVDLRVPLDVSTGTGTDWQLAAH